MKKNLLLLFPLLLCFSVLVQAETKITLSPSFLDFDYTEFGVNNEFLDNESGWLPGLSFKVNNVFYRSWSAEISADYYQGDVDYLGKTQSGKSHTTITDTRFLRLGARINKRIYKDTNVFLGVKLHQWNRDIRSKNAVSGIDETYKWREHSAGINTDFFVKGNNIFNLDAAYLWLRNASMDADLSSVDLGSATLDLGDESGSRFILSWRRVLPDNIQYGVSIFLESWAFGRSNTQITQGGSSSAAITEPRSETQNMGVRFNMGYLFN